MVYFLYGRRAGRPSAGGGGMRVGSPPTRTPWGDPDNVEKLDEGVYRVGTPSHGGIMVERSVGDQILSPTEKAIGRRGNSLASEWYTFEEDVDWAQAANALARLDAGLSRTGGAEKQVVRLPADEVMPGDVVYPPDPTGNAPRDGMMIVDSVEKRDDGTYFHSTEGGGYLLPEGESLSTERLVVPGYEPDFGGAPPSQSYRQQLREEARQAAQWEEGLSEWDTMSDERKISLQEALDAQADAEHVLSSTYRAQDDAEDEGIDWNMLSPREQQERVDRASQALLEEQDVS